MQKNKQAFTLIELLVVILIIGILAAVAVPQYQKAVELTEAKMIIANLHTVKKAENLYKLEHGNYTYNWEELDVAFVAKEISKDKRTLYAQDERDYTLSKDGTYPHVFGYPRGTTSYALYLAFNSSTQLCYPKGTATGKRVCKYLGCAADKLDNSYCSFAWKP